MGITKNLFAFAVCLVLAFIHFSILDIYDVPPVQFLIDETTWEMELLQECRCDVRHRAAHAGLNIFVVNFDVAGSACLRSHVAVIIVLRLHWSFGLGRVDKRLILRGSCSTNKLLAKNGQYQ